ncbi:hypothetical protein B0H63DRAFT_445590 [Podospora didyma]|uniref:Uncharacterized protein n=1 Tax=Podospora didyma TaxID=330526 RepID=A0AAE0U396_9PEZI|nr:hypothetical protein B0H63DRAFT_445590 [Podospora didyma]
MDSHNASRPGGGGPTQNAHQNMFEPWPTYRGPPNVEHVFGGMPKKGSEQPHSSTQQARPAQYDYFGTPFQGPPNLEQIFGDPNAGAHGTRAGTSTSSNDPQAFSGTPHDMPFSGHQARYVYPEPEKPEFTYETPESAVFWSDMERLSKKDKPAAAYLAELGLVKYGYPPEGLARRLLFRQASARAAQNAREQERVEVEEAKRTFFQYVGIMVFLAIVRGCITVSHSPGIYDK